MRSTCSTSALPPLLAWISNASCGFADTADPIQARAKAELERLEGLQNDSWRGSAYRRASSARVHVSTKTQWRRFLLRSPTMSDPDRSLYAWVYCPPQLHRASEGVSAISASSAVN